jgi:hypothetical protein
MLNGLLFLQVEVVVTVGFLLIVRACLVVSFLALLLLLLLTSLSDVAQALIVGIVVVIEY